MLDEKRARLMTAAGSYWRTVAALEERAREIHAKHGCDIVMLGQDGCRLAITFPNEEYWLQTPSEPLVA